MLDRVEVRGSRFFLVVFGSLWYYLGFDVFVFSWFALVFGGYLLISLNAQFVYYG